MSGGVVMHGTHCLRTWISTPSVVPLSSGEAEYYSLVEGAAAGFGPAASGDLAEAAEITQPAWHRRGLRARGLEAIGWAARRLL